MLWCCVLLSLVAPALCVVGGDPAAPPDPDAAVVFVQKHGRSARLEGAKRDQVYVFQGIRYGQSPTGARRFQRPAPHYLSGDLTARSPCAVCPQLNHKTGAVRGNEDCLCLNVFAPSMPGDEKSSPVIIFFHGGNYQTGSSVYVGGKNFAEHDTILVAPQYRLGSLGLLSTGETDASGNMALFDMRLAINWVRDYIEFFGGDPGRVVLMGHGSGAAAAALLGMAAEGRGAARGVAALAGAPLASHAVRPPAGPTSPAQHLDHLARYTNCPRTPTRRLIHCLRTLPAELIVKADADLTPSEIDTTKFLDDISGRSGVGARVEGEHDRRSLPPLIAENPATSIKKKQSCSLITGVNSAETARAVYGKYSNFLKGKLEEVKDFINRELLGGLRNVTNAVEGLVPVMKVGQDLLDRYYGTLMSNSVDTLDGLSKIAEATADALFNLPALQTVKAWMAEDGSQAIFYSFEHQGNLTKGAHYLPGVVLAEPGDNSKDINGPAHGDELAYLFEPLDEQGNPIEENVSPADAKVRKAFIGLFADIAKNIGTKKSKPLFKLPSKDNQYLKIGDAISIEKDYRICQMSLWENNKETVTGALCKTVLGDLFKIEETVKNIPDKIVPKPPKLKLPLSLPGLSRG